MKKVLIAAPVNDRAWILPEFLESIKALNTEGFFVGYLFVENDSTDESLKILQEQTADWLDCTVVSESNPLPVYDRKVAGVNSPSYRRLAEIRDYIRRAVVDGGYDLLLSVDSDIMLQPDTLQRLAAHELDFVAAMIANSGSASFAVVNAVDYRPASGPPPYNSPASWYRWIPQGKGVRQVAVTGAAFLASRAVLEACTYLSEAVTQSPYWRGSQSYTPGEDEVFAVSCFDKGFPQHLDESLRGWHCYNADLLEIYRQAQRRYRKQAVKKLTDRAWAGVDQKLLAAGCVSCGQKQE